MMVPCIIQLHFCQNDLERVRNRTHSKSPNNLFKNSPYFFSWRNATNFTKPRSKLKHGCTEHNPPNVEITRIRLLESVTWCVSTNHPGGKGRLDLSIDWSNCDACPAWLTNGFGGKPIISIFLNANLKKLRLDNSINYFRIFYALM